MTDRARRAVLARAPLLTGLLALALALPGASASRKGASAAAYLRTRAARPARAPGPAIPVQDILVSLDHRLASFSPDRALGASLDGHQRGETRQIYTRANERAMISAGLAPVDYRLRTELGVAAWHWNPIGRWSNPAAHDGYWTSSPVPGRSSLASFGYDLPRRGDTIDQANDQGYSRLDDGSPRSFWKSNPYLDPFYTRGEEHPQWVLIDLGARHLLDAVRIAWDAPYATHLRIQWWQGPQALVEVGHAPGRWRDFPRGGFAGHPGVQTLTLARNPLSVRFVRVLLNGSSHTAPPGSRDVRDRLGYAIREIYAGRFRRRRFVDLIRHGVRRQTVTYVSSTDPWHAASNLDRNYEQPAFATVLHSGLTRGLPVLVAVPVLYGTPQDAVGELRYLRALKIPIAGVELGEEPTGQYVSPEDYGALYLQFARAIHRYDRTLALGGPGYETSIPDFLAQPDAEGEIRRFVDYLRSHNALDQLGFFSFEWYPFDDGCRAVGPQLASAASLLAAVMQRVTLDGVPSNIPRVITEFGYSSFATRDEVDLAGAVLDADTTAEFLALGGARAYLYGYEPSPLMRELPDCRSWGNLTLLQSDARHRVKGPVAAYWGTRLLTRFWAQPGAAPNTIVATSATGGAPLAAYALRRPDGKLAILLLNKDPRRARPVALSLARDHASRPLSGRVSVEQLSGKQYVWRAAGKRGHARPDGPPAHSTLLAGPGTELALPPLSITVVRTEGPLD